MKPEDIEKFKTETQEEKIEHFADLSMDGRKELINSLSYDDIKDIVHRFIEPAKLFCYENLNLEERKKYFFDAKLEDKRMFLNEMGDLALTELLSLCTDEQKNLIYNISAPNTLKNIIILSDEKERRNICQNINSETLKELLNITSDKDKRIIFENMNPKDLKEYYKRASKEEQESIRTIISNYQINIQNNINRAHNDIDGATSLIQESEQTITQSKTNIANAETKIKENNQNLKIQQKVNKKLDKEKDKALAAYKKALNKAHSLSPLNKIGIISRRRAKKLKEKLENLQAREADYNKGVASANKIQENINELKAQKQRAQEAIREANATIEYANKVIKESNETIKKSNVTIKKMTKIEKIVLGRKLAHQTLKERDCVVVTSITRTVTTLEAQSKAPTPEAKQPESTKVEKSPKVHNGVGNVAENKQHPDTREQITNLIGVVQKLVDMGVNISKPSEGISPQQLASILNKPIATLQGPELVVIQTFLDVLNKVNEIKKQNEENLANEQNKGHQRVKVKIASHGNVSLLLLTSIILFAISLLLFISK